jgi:hypothetical protein
MELPKVPSLQQFIATRIPLLRVYAQVIMPSAYYYTVPISCWNHPGIPSEKLEILD